MQRPWWLPALLLLLFVVLRVPYIHPAISEFPQDRNATTTSAILSRIEQTDFSHPLTLLHLLIDKRSYQPEFQLIANIGWFGSWVGCEPVVAARIGNLLISLLLAWGVYLLGGSLWNRAVGAVALVLLAINPLSILMSCSLLPDPAMLMLVTWGLVAAARAAPAMERRPRLAAAIFCASMILLPIMKLPGSLFCPMVALLYLNRRGWRTAGAWQWVIFTGVASYLCMCWWYDFSLVTPWRDLEKMRQEFDHLSAKPVELFGSWTIDIVYHRLILGLTLPGVLLAAAGLLLQLRCHQRSLMLLVWSLTSLLFGWINFKANAYWIYPCIPPAIVCTAVLLQRVSRMGIGVLAGVLLTSSLLLIPDTGWRTIRHFIRVESAYVAITDHLDLLHPPVLLRELPFRPGLAFELHRPTTVFESPAPLQQVRAGQFGSYVSPFSTFDEFDMLVFKNRPLAYYQTGCKIFHIAATDTIGTTTLLPVKPLNLDLHGQLRLLGYRFDPERPRPGKPFMLTLEYAREPAFRPEQTLVLQWRHRPSSALLAIRGQTHAFTNSDSRIILQTPDFAVDRHKQVTYTFTWPGQPCGGELVPELSLYTEFAIKNKVGEWSLPAATIDGGAIQPAWQAEPNALYWIGEASDILPAPWGRTRSVMRMIGRTRVYFFPPVKPGSYRLELQASATFAGGEIPDCWPQIRVNVGSQPPAKVRIDGWLPKTYSVPLQLPREHELVMLEIDNPLAVAPRNIDLPLYLGSDAPGERSVELREIRLHPVEK